MIWKSVFRISSRITADPTKPSPPVTMILNSVFLSSQAYAYLRPFPFFSWPSLSQPIAESSARVTCDFTESRFEPVRFQLGNGLWERSDHVRTLSWQATANFRISGPCQITHANRPRLNRIPRIADNYRIFLRKLISLRIALRATSG